MDYPISFEDCKAYALGLFKARSHIQDSDIISLVDYRFNFAVIQYRLTKYQCPANRSADDNALITNFETSFPELAITVAANDIRHKLCGCVSSEERDKNLKIVESIAKTLSCEEEADKPTVERLVQETIEVDHGTVPVSEQEIFLETVIDDAINDELTGCDSFRFESNSDEYSIVNCFNSSTIDSTLCTYEVAGSNTTYLGNQSETTIETGINLPSDVLNSQPLERTLYNEQSTIIIHDDLPNEFPRSDNSRSAAALVAIKGIHKEINVDHTSDVKESWKRRRAIRGALIVNFGHKTSQLRVQIGNKVITLPKNIVYSEQAYLAYLQWRHPNYHKENDFEYLVIYYWWILTHNDLATSTTAMNCIHHYELRKWKFSALTTKTVDSMKFAQLLI